MRLVVLDPELHEALTVVEVSASLFREVVRDTGRRLHLAVPPDFALSWPSERDEPTEIKLEIVTLTLEPVMQGREPDPLFWFAYPDDPTLALKLRAAFLPGQIGEVQRREQEAFWRGVFAHATL